MAGLLSMAAAARARKVAGLLADPEEKKSIASLLSKPANTQATILQDPAMSQPVMPAQPVATPTATPVAAQTGGNTLADQLRAQGGDWNIQGIDRATELAGILQANGITDLSKLGFKTDAEAGAAMRENQGDKSPDPTFVTYGGQDLGMLKREGGQAASSLGQYDEGAGGSNVLARSVAGHGNVTFQAVPQPDGTVKLQPNWNSSSDAGKIQKAAAVIGAPFALNALVGAGVLPSTYSAAAEAAPTSGLLSSTPLTDYSAATDFAANPLTPAMTDAQAASLVQPMAPTMPAASVPMSPGLSALQSAPLTDYSAATNFAANPLTPAMTDVQAASLVPASMSPTLAPALPMAAPQPVQPPTQPAASSFHAADNYGPGMTGAQTTAYDTTVGLTGSKALADVAGAYAGGGIGSALSSAGSNALDFIKANPGLAVGAASTLAGAIKDAAKPAGPAPYTGPMPTITRGNWQANVTPTYGGQQQQQPMGSGLLSVQRGQANDGLWRFGLLGK